MQNITGNMPRVEGVGTALPSNYVSQESLFTALRDYWAERGARLDGFDRLHKATKVSGRYLALPMIEYRALVSFERSNNVWIRVASEIGSEAARNALSLACVAAEEVDHLFLVTGTGIATPSIDSRIIATLGLRTDVKRTPIFGLGCAGGAAGIARAADYLRAFSNENALLIAVELCSLTLQHGDISVANMIASGLFGDGAAAAVISGGASGDRVGPQVVAGRSILYPNTESLMGWQVTDSGFKIVMSPDIPHVVRQNLPRDVDHFLRHHGLDRRHIKYWVAHTGGPKVLRSIEEGLELPPSALKYSWDSLSRMGNLSSASVLFVFSDLIRANDVMRGDYGLMIAMGPGFCLELVLIRW